MLTNIQIIDNLEHECCDLNPQPPTLDCISVLQPLITNEVLGNNHIYLNAIQENIIRMVDGKICTIWTDINQLQNALLSEIGNLRNSTELRLRVLEDNLVDQNTLKYRLQNLQCDIEEYHNKYTFYYNELNDRRIQEAKRHKQKLDELSEDYIKNVIDFFKSELETKNAVSLSQIGDTEFSGEILPDLQCYINIAEEQDVPLLSVIPLHILSKLMH